MTRTILGSIPDAAAVAVYAAPDERTTDDQVMASIELVEGRSLRYVVASAATSTRSL